MNDIELEKYVTDEIAKCRLHMELATAQGNIRLACNLAGRAAFAIDLGRKMGFKSPAFVELSTLVAPEVGAAV